GGGGGAGGAGGGGGAAGAGRRRGANGGGGGTPGGSGGAAAGGGQRGAGGFGGGGGGGQSNADIYAELDKAGANGRISSSRNELVQTSGPNWKTVTYEKHPGMVQVTVRRSDYDRLQRNMDF